MKKYDHLKIEKKWQEQWRKDGLYTTNLDSTKEKAYVLDMFPYPSGEGLHVGHPKGYIASDIYARYKKMSGFEVLHPMGWDAFGLPAENFAIKQKIHPRVAVEKNIKNFRSQLDQLGFNYDWSKEINTTDPKFYKWTQWMFLKMFEKGLVYESYEPINWCPSCQTGLANEDVERDGTCERCGSVVEKKPMRQWVVKITKYADRLLEDLELLSEWPPHIKEAQRNWIGKSEGAEIEFGIKNHTSRITVFTTRPDTLFGVTYMVLAPEHGLVKQLLDEQNTELRITNKKEVLQYIEVAKKRSEIERTADGKEKTGVKLEGIFAVNPASNEAIPVFIADYVLMGYGTGAIMAVPAHDERDFAFAKKFNLPIRQVIAPRKIQTTDPGAFREGESFVITSGVIVLVKHWKEDTYLGLRWKEVGWGTLLTGGIEEGHTAHETVLKEIREETGFQNARIVRDMGVVDGMFYHEPKKQNRLTHGHMYYAELEDGTQEAISNEEKNRHDIVWVTLEDMRSFLTAPTHRYALEEFSKKESAYTGEGTVINSGKFDGLDSDEAKETITAAVGGTKKVTYHLRDWVFSRQRYWGEPIPIIHCKKCGVVPVPEKELPVELPDVESYEPTGTGESPLATISDWVNVSCPTCGGAGKRETNTMPQWAGSSWYYLRFLDPDNDTAPTDSEIEKKWMPVDVYVGGDHAVRHLIYARFWHKFLFDIKMVHTKEPFTRLEFLGFILAEDGKKMSKRKGNVINPDDIVGRVGADTLRVYEMFMGPFENTIAWSTDNLIGARRFLERVWRLQENVSNRGVDDVPTLDKTIKKVGEDIERFKFNTAASQLMILLNELERQEAISQTLYNTYLVLLAPFAPHITEELWSITGETSSIHVAPWPSYDARHLREDTTTIAIQINGKVRDTIKCYTTEPEDRIMERALGQPNINRWINGKKIIKTIYVPGKIINIVVADAKP